MTHDLDIALCILPKIQPDSPTVGPAVLKSHCREAGFSARVIDLNIDLFRSLGMENKHYWYESDDVFFKDDQWAEFYPEHCEPVFERWADELVAMNARFIGLSVFSNRSVHSAVKLIDLIKRRRPDQQIVVGGAGTYHRQKVWHRHGADYWIMGDAEVSLIELLRGNTTHEGINNTKAFQVDDLDTVLYPDYGDIDFTRYHTEGPDPTRSVYITGSRGCVRDCTFCDVASMWPKYRYRSGGNIAGEMIEVRQRHGVDLFEFTDSLVNGSLKAFRQMCESLADYRERSGDTGWSWSSQFICRSATQMTAEDYELMRRSGCGLVSIGIESGSYSVRTHMRKGFTNDDMWHTFSQLRRNDIRLSLMMLVGYPTETVADFNETLKFLEDLASGGYLGDMPNGLSIISTISFGPTMEIYSGSPMYDMQHEMGITRDASGHWVYGDNNIRVRIIRLLKSYAMLTKLGYGRNWWMATRRNMNLREQYTKLSGRNLPDDILSYDESLEYERAMEVA